MATDMSKVGIFGGSQKTLLFWTNELNAYGPEFDIRENGPRKNSDNSKVFLYDIETLLNCQNFF